MVLAAFFLSVGEKLLVCAGLFESQPTQQE